MPGAKKGGIQLSGNIISPRDSFTRILQEVIISNFTAKTGWRQKYSQMNYYVFGSHVTWYV